MKVLVTGGLGFIGSHFVEHCLEKDDEVTNIDLQTYAANDNKIFSKYKNYKFIKGDIRDSRIFDKVGNQFDFIVNFAAETHVDNSIKSSKDFLTTNFTGAGNVFDFARHNNIHIIQISTDEVFGDYDEITKYEHLSWNGIEPTYKTLMPSNPYSAAKSGAELLLKSLHHTYKNDRFKWSIVRFSNAYGPRQHKEKLLPKVITNLLNNKEIPVYDIGDQTRQWTYVGDIALHLRNFLTSGARSNLYHICSDDRLTNIDMIMRIVKQIQKVAKIKIVADRKGHDKAYWIQNSVRNKYFTKLSKGLDKTIGYYRCKSSS